MKKNNIKKIFWFVSAFILLGPIHRTLAGPATDTLNGQGLLKLTNPLKWDTVGEVINGIMDAVLVLGGVVAVIMIILSGFKLILAQGNTDKISEAKNMFFWTVIGIAVLFGAKVITSVIQNTVNSLKP